MKSTVEDEGRKARLDGKKIEENPYYDTDTELFQFWENGYLSAKSPRPDNPPPPPVKAVA